MKQGEVWWVNFDPSVDGEIRKKRPAVIVSNNIANKYLNRVQAAPLTSRTGRVYPNEALVHLGQRQNKAMTVQLTTVGKRRLMDTLGRVSRDDMLMMESAIRIQHGL